jgi:signal transduction histidine kinase
MTTPQSPALVRTGDDQPSELAREHARGLVHLLTGRGLCASWAAHVATPSGAVAVSAQRVDVKPYVGRLVLLLPVPGRDGLYWHWQRPLYGHPRIRARWFQPFRPATQADAAADAIAAVIDADARTQARLAHTAAAQGGTDAEFERQVLTRMGRPLHLLVHRTLALLDAVERGVEDTILLHELFKIDHLTTRTLRGLERLVVLGGATARQVNSPLPLATVMRQAVAQVEQYSRVRVQVPPPQVEADLPGWIGPEITLLLAELAENATKFSPPDTEVQMAAVPTSSGLSIEVTDRGLSIPVDRRAVLNRLLAAPEAVSLRDQIIQGPIGLLVAARLAQRHGVRVTLHPNDPEGTRAVVALPDALLMSPRSLAAPAAKPPRSASASAAAPAPAPGTAAAASVRAAAEVPAAAAPTGGQLPRRRRTTSEPPPAPAAPQAPASAAPVPASSPGGRPALPRRTRVPAPKGSAPVFPSTSADPEPDATQTSGQGAAPEPGRSPARGPEQGPGQQAGRGPVAGLMADFTAGTRTLRANGTTGQGPAREDPPAEHPTD